MALNIPNIMLKTLNEIANIIIALGTLLSIFGLEIGASPVEETFDKGRLKKGVLVEIVRPNLLKPGVFLVITGSLLQIIIPVVGIFWR